MCLIWLIAVGCVSLVHTMEANHSTNWLTRKVLASLLVLMIITTLAVPRRRRVPSVGGWRGQFVGLQQQSCVVSSHASPAKPCHVRPEQPCCVTAPSPSHSSRPDSVFVSGLRYEEGFCLYVCCTGLQHHHHHQYYNSGMCGYQCRH